MRTRRTALTLSMAVMALSQSGAVLAQSAEPTIDPDSTTVVLRMTVAGGFVPMSVALLEVPQFTLYADGTVIFRPSVGGTFDAPPPLVQAQLSDEQMTALLAYAIGPGGLGEAAPTYDEMFVTDMPTTTFVIDTPELSKTVSAYALGVENPAGSPDAEILARLDALADTLGSFQEQVAAGNVESVELYQPLSYLATFTPDVEGNTATPEPWPFADVPAPTFPDDLSFVTMVLTPDQVAQVTTVPSGGVGDLYYEDASGQRFHVTIRPMLPDEPLPVDTAS